MENNKTRKEKFVFMQPEGTLDIIYAKLYHNKVNNLILNYPNFDLIKIT